VLLRVSLACCFASARSLRQAAVCWAMMFASLLGRSLAVYRCHHSTTGRCVSSSLVLFFRVVFRSTRIAFSTTIILRHQAHTQPQTHDERADVSPLCTWILERKSQPAHAGSAGTQLLPWMVCRCFLGWSSSSAAAPRAASTMRQMTSHVPRVPVVWIQAPPHCPCPSLFLHSVPNFGLEHAHLVLSVLDVEDSCSFPSL